jgi:hypothetical protein
MIPLSLFFISLLFIFPVVLGKINVTKTTFQDPRTGIPFHYPTDWKVTTKEYVNAILGDKMTLIAGCIKILNLLDL